MNNKTILKYLEKRKKNDEVRDGHSVNAEMLIEWGSCWDKDESEFPINEIRRYIRLNEWTFEDFGFEAETVIRDILPDYYLDIFFMMKEFRERSRAELTSTQEVWAKMNGLPYNTQDEKAFCVYGYAIQKYINNSQLSKGE